MSNCKCGGSWRTDGQHSNEFCAKCFTSRPREAGCDPYNSTARPPASDVVEFAVPDTIEVITLCDPETLSS